MSTDVSIIVCTFNRSAMLRGSLASLCNQRMATNISWEVLVVDNNCTDDTDRVTREAAKNLALPLRCVREEKQGLSNARNRGISASTGRYLLFTDDDTRPRPDWAQTIWETFEKDSCDAVGGKVEIIWPVVKPSWFADELISSLAGVDYGQQEIELTTEKPPLGANMAFRREVFDRVGGFDPELGRIGGKLLGGEETELFGRLCAAGMSGKYQPRAIVGHVIEQERIRKQYFRKVYFYGGQSRGRSYLSYSVKQVAGVPTFAVRQFCEKIISVFGSMVTGKPEESFMKELHAWWLLGFMAGCSSAHSLLRR